jgi:hypothetical protein
MGKGIATLMYHVPRVLGYHLTTQKELTIPGQTLETEKPDGSSRGCAKLRLGAVLLVTQTDFHVLAMISQ